MLEVPPLDQSPDLLDQTSGAQGPLPFLEKKPPPASGSVETSNSTTFDGVNSDSATSASSGPLPDSELEDSSPSISSTQPQQSESVLKGTVRRILFRNSTNLYSVLEVTLEGKSEKATVVGPCIQIREQDEILAHGKFVRHHKFGNQFSASIIERLEPSSAAGIAKYLGSGLIKGIGLHTAKRIVKKFGDETFEIIHRKPNLVAAIPGVGKHKAELIRQAFHA